MFDAFPVQCCLHCTQGFAAFLNRQQTTALAKYYGYFLKGKFQHKKSWKTNTGDEFSKHVI